MPTYVVSDTYYEDPLVISHTKGSTIKRIVVIKDRKTTVITPMKGHVYVDTHKFSLKECEAIKKIDIDENLIKRLLDATEEQRLLFEEARDLIDMGM